MARTSVNFIEQIFRNLKNYNGIVFLDRDGTINEEVDYLHGKMQIKILPKVIEAIKLLNKNKIAAVIVTNQPVVARGMISVSDLKSINDELVEILKRKKAYIDAVYSCPHHPEKNHPDIPKQALKFRIKCDCRKPGLAMYLKAVKYYKANKIFGVIGDQTADILAGKELGTRGILVKTGHMGEDKKHDVKPHYVYDNLLDAVSSCIGKLL